MTELWSIATLAAAIGSGLVAGIFYGFSTFIMAGLGRIAAPEGIRAMQAINVAVINPLFLLAFFGTALVAAVVGARATTDLAGSGPLVLAGSLLYLLGTILVTMARNVPLNNRLAAADADSPEGAALWARYLRDWTFWNHVRTLAALVAAVLLTLGWRAG